MKKILSVNFLYFISYYIKNQYLFLAEQTKDRKIKVFSPILKNKRKKKANFFTKNEKIYRNYNILYQLQNIRNINN